MAGEPRARPRNTKPLGYFLAGQPETATSRVPLRLEGLQPIKDRFNTPPVRPVRPNSGTLFRRLPLVLKQWRYMCLFAGLGDHNVIFRHRYPVFVMIKRL